MTAAHRERWTSNDAATVGLWRWALPILESCPLPTGRPRGARWGHSSRNSRVLAPTPSRIVAPPTIVGTAMAQPGGGRSRARSSPAFPTARPLAVRRADECVALRPGTVFRGRVPDRAPGRRAPERTDPSPSGRLLRPAGVFFVQRASSSSGRLRPATHKGRREGTCPPFAPPIGCRRSRRDPREKCQGVATRLKCRLKGPSL